LAECGLEFVTMGLSASGHSVLLVSKKGDIVISPMPGRGRVETCVRAQNFAFKDGFKDAATRPGTNVIIMRDHADGLLAWKKHRASGKIIWRIPKPSTLASAPEQRQITSYRLSPDGTRVGVLRGHTLLEIWSLAASHKPVSRFSVGQAPIVHFDFSPYSHALLVATQARTFVVLPTMPKPLKIPVPHIGATAQFMQGMLRIVGYADGHLWDINLGDTPEPDHSGED